MSHLAFACIKIKSIQFFVPYGLILALSLDSAATHADSHYGADEQGDAS